MQRSSKTDMEAWKAENINMRIMEDINWISVPECGGNSELLTKIILIRIYFSFLIDFFLFIIISLNLIYFYFFRFNLF